MPSEGAEILQTKTISQHRPQSGADQSVGYIEARALFGPDGRGKTMHLGTIAGILPRTVREFIQ